MLFYGKSDVGAVRHENQDCFGIYELLPGVTLALICDGMGGNAGGSVASRLAIDTFAEMMRETLIPDDPGERAVINEKTVRRALESSAGASNRRVYDKSLENDGKLSGMGTTLVGLLTVGNELAWSINVGDSRLYALSDAGMLQLTRDHSLVQQMIDSGSMKPEEAGKSPMRNIITKAIGTDTSVEADIRSVDTGLPGEKRYFLLCSDGLYVCVEREKIAEILAMNAELPEKAELLVRAALRAGAPDNVTVILAEN